MRQKRLIIFLFIIACSSCKKNEIDVTLTPHEEQRIVGEGMISQHHDHQQFLFSLSNALGNDKQTVTNDPELLVKTPEGIIHFISDADGWYHSEIPFQGVPGEKYTIQFTYKGEIHEAVTTMPYAAGVNAVLLPDTTEVTFPFSTGELILELSSDTLQWVHIDLFHKSEEWAEVPIPVYQKYLLTKDTTQTIVLNLDFTLPILNQGDSLLIVSKSLSTDVSDYLDQLQSYVTNEVVNSQYHNPPYFYTNGAYGLGYGAYVDSLYHVVGE
jgi:hypothetical protein